ncbi:hypothetical protein EPN96_12495 [bacterium]|nr:MAG: hypothetical protein EPN96_12495 [bacterium]
MFLLLLTLPLPAAAGAIPGIGEPEELLQSVRDGNKSGDYCAALADAEKLFSGHADTALFHVNEELVASAWYSCALKKKDPPLKGGRLEKELKLLRQIHSELKAKEDKTPFELFVLSTAPSAEGEPYEKSALTALLEKFPGTPPAVWADFILTAGIRGEPAKIEEFLSRHKDSRLVPTARILVGNWLWLSPETVAEAVDIWKNVRRAHPASLLDYYTAGERLSQAGEALPPEELKLRPLVLGFYMGTETNLKTLRNALENGGKR